ncbi:MAG: hypothetical protein ABIT01_05580 [Thermoanaerobaculia bacterium]
MKMASLARWLTFGTLFFLASFSAIEASAAPVIATHPRLIFNAAGKSRLVAKRTANDASWQALKARADTLATYTINPYKSASASSSPLGTIFYTYQGEGWLSATLPLGFAYQISSDVKYANKLIELAQEMIRAQVDPENNPPNGLPPIRLDSYYASRNVASALAFIYDYAYDQLGATLKPQLVTLMNQYFDDVKVNGYQAQQFSAAADGNYFGGHLYGVALMGYASFGDNPRAQEMIEWARIRFDGTSGSTLTPATTPAAWRSQVFDGGLRPAVALDFDGPDVSGNPFKGGFDFQGWSYGSEEFSRMIDYMLTVKSATGEDVLTPNVSWFSQMLRGEKHALFPNRFMIDPTGDWGGFQGAVISRGLPSRLAFVLAGTADGPAAQHFAETEIGESTVPDAQVFPAEAWEAFYFTEATRPSTELVLPPFYTAFSPSYPQAAPSPGGTNGAIPYFIMRSDWGATATWASVQMGTQWWDDHQHYAAGHVILARGSDYLLVSATDWKSPLDNSGNLIHGGPGILGISLEYQESSLSNTLYFDDFGDFQSAQQIASGGQFAVGIDQVVADELNQDLSYVRSDLSTAYNRAGDPSDTPNRKLDSFYRSFLYLRASNLFVVYDQVTAKPSTNAKGAYKKHLRWHVPSRPVIAGNTATMDQGQSRLFIDTVLPANAAFTVVDELTNPDPCDGSDAACVPFGTSNAGTYRLEVRDPLNPLFVPFLTVLQPGSATSTAPSNAQITSIDGKMIGVEITQAGGARSIVLFNNQSGQVPAPITSTSYNVAGSALVSHTLLGVVPGARYSVVSAGGVVQISQSPAGDRTASPAGVLHFSAGTAAATTASVLIPSGARASGLGGAFYTTDLTIANTGSTATTFVVKFLGNNADGRNGAEQGFSIAAGATTTFSDVLGSVFGLTADFGAIRITSASEALRVLAQTSTPGFGGTFGQSVPAARSEDLITGGSPRSLLAVREDEAFRTNLILANATEESLDVDVTLIGDSGAVLGTAGKRFRLQPLGMTQITRVVRALDVTADVSGARLVLSTPAAGKSFAAYASVIDNVTNDPRTLLPVAPIAGARPAPDSWFLPSTARAGGSGGAFYTTDVTVAYTHSISARFTLKFLGNNIDGRGGPEQTFDLGAQKSATYTDVLGSVFQKTADFGAMRVSSQYPASDSNFIGVLAQTSTPGFGGTFGQSVPAATAADLIRVGGPRSVLAIREDAAFRTNLILANTTESTLAVDVQLIAATGEALATKRYTLAPLGMTQVTRVVRDLGIETNVSGARLVLSTVTPGGAFAAYASAIDNVTNDPRTLLPR